MSISPISNAVIKYVPATLTAMVIGATPSGYQWQLNGTNISNATNFNYNIASVSLTDVGAYTVIANGVTSTPSTLTISTPAGSGIWTNLLGGSWVSSNNWSDMHIADGVDAVADFSTLSLSANRTVTLDGAHTFGSLILDDLNPTKHSWTISTGIGSAALTLATSNGVPNIVVKNISNTLITVVAGTRGFIKTGAGSLTLTGFCTFTGTVNVNEGLLEVQNKNGNTPYVVAKGATLKIGYSTGGGYANTGLTIYGGGAAATTGFYLAGGKTYNANGQIRLLIAPTTIRQYGAGMASISAFDINTSALWCSADASGSALDANVQMSSSGYGMSAQIDAGTNTATGDLVINGPLNLSGGSTLGFFKRGTGSLLLKAVAITNISLQVESGTVLCGATNCIGIDASVPIASGAKLALNGFDQKIGALSVNAGSRVILSSSNTLTVSKPPLWAGTLQMAIAKSPTPVSSKLVVSSGTLTNSGSLIVTNLNGSQLAAGDTFTLTAVQNNPDSGDWVIDYR